MDNLYYYTFYVLAKLARKVKVRVPAVTAMAWLSIPLLLNILSVFTLLGIFHHRESEIEVDIKVGIITIIILIINYMLFIKNKKYEDIFVFFDEKYANTKLDIFKTTLIVLFYLLSFIGCIYLAKLNRENIAP